MFFVENGHLCLWVSPWKFVSNVKNVVGQNSYNLYYRLGCFLQMKWYKIRAFFLFFVFFFFFKNTSMMEFVRVG